jgi:hypothetical protein
VIGAALEDDFDVIGARVLGDVVERFLRDSIEGGFDLGRQAIVGETRGVEIGRHAHARRPVLQVVGQRRAQAEIVECRRPQLPHQVIDVAIELLGHCLERFDLGRQLGMRRARILEGADAQRQRGQLFAELIVHLSSNAAPLVFLREDQPSQQLGASALGTLPFIHFGAQRSVGIRELRRALLDPLLELIVRPPERFFRFLPFGEVEMRADDTNDIAVAAHWQSPRQDVDVVAVLVTDAKFSQVRALASHHTVELFMCPHDIVGMKQALPRIQVRPDLAIGVAEHFLPSR